MHQKHFQRFLAFVSVFSLITAQAVLGQSNESITRTQADDILKELRLIRQLLERQQAPQAPPKPAVASVANTPFPDFQSCTISALYPCVRPPAHA